MFTETMEDTINRKMATVSNITAEAMKKSINQIKEDNAQLEIHVTYLTKEVGNKVALNVIPAWSPSAMATYLQLI